MYAPVTCFRLPVSPNAIEQPGRAYELSEWQLQCGAAVGGELAEVRVERQREVLGLEGRRVHVAQRAALESVRESARHVF